MDQIGFLELSDVMQIHVDQIANYGGSIDIRDPNLLESAIEQPRATYGGSYLHAFPFEMAAAYLFHIVMNHPFVDGNERTGGPLLRLYFLNGMELQLKPNLEKFRISRWLLRRVRKANARLRPGNRHYQGSPEHPVSESRDSRLVPSNAYGGLCRRRDGQATAEPKHRNFVARFKHFAKTRNPRFDLFEPNSERRKSSPGKEKAVRIFVRTAFNPVKSG